MLQRNLNLSLISCSKIPHLVHFLPPPLLTFELTIDKLSQYISLLVDFSFILISIAPNTRTRRQRDISKLQPLIKTPANNAHPDGKNSCNDRGPTIPATSLMGPLVSWLDCGCQYQEHTIPRHTISKDECSGRQNQNHMIPTYMWLEAESISVATGTNSERLRSRKGIFMRPMRRTGAAREI